MIGKLATSQQSKHKGSKHQFLVHLLKITRLLTHVPISTVDITPHQRRDVLKVTALYNSHQIALGDFPVLINECVIDRKLTCHFSVSNPEIQSKLHLYIDQIYSSGLTGHLALDLHEFVREGESEIYLKYPLYANTSRHCRGPVLKVMIKYLGIRNAEPFSDEDNEIILLPHQSMDKRHRNGVSSLENTGCMLRDSHFNLNRQMQPSQIDEQASLSQLEGALSEISEKLRTLVSTFKSRDDSQNGDYLREECQSSTTSPLLSSLHTGTSVDSCSEMYEEQGTDSDDVFDSSLDLGSSTYPLSIPKHSRTLSDISSHTSSLRYQNALRQGRNMSSEAAFSESWFPQSNTTNGENFEYKHHCIDECFICSSAHALQSYEGIQASLSRSKSVSSRPKSLQLNASQASTARMPVQLDRHSFKKVVKEEAPAARKGPGLLKSLFGAVVVAGVSLLGVRNSNWAGELSQSTGVQTKLSRTSRSSVSSDIRSSVSSDIRSEKNSRHRYSFRR